MNTGKGGPVNPEGFGFALRYAAGTDLPQVCHLLGQLGYPFEKEHLEECWARVLQDPESEVIVAAHGKGALAGLITLKTYSVLRLGGECMNIEELVVASGHRNMNIGTRLLDRAFECARQRNVRYLSVQSSRTRKSYSRKFYTRRGFIESAKAVFLWYPDDPAGGQHAGANHSAEECEFK